MWVYPALAGNLRWSNWRTIRTEGIFLIQKYEQHRTPAQETSIEEALTTTNELHKRRSLPSYFPSVVYGTNNGTTKSTISYRIVTRSLPHYRGK
jgi:hypothetical protein